MRIKEMIKNNRSSGSLYRITLESNVEVMIIKEMITNFRSYRMVNQFSLSAPQEMYREQYGEYAY